MKMKNAIIFTSLLFGVLSFLPAQDTEQHFPPLEGWKLTVEESVYTPNNLWDIIDGAADLFLEYNFVDLHIARYQLSPEVEIKVELYRHKSAVDAFGMYSQERFPDYHFIELGTQGYGEKGSLNFLCGEFYVKISTVQSASEAQEAMLKIGTALAKRLGGPGSWPSMLSAFPRKGLQSNSEQYVSRNFLGYSFFNAVYTASYDAAGKSKSFIMSFLSEAEARKTVDTYLATLPKESIAKSAGERFRITDPHSGILQFVRSGTRVYGVLGVEGGTAEELLTELGRRLAGLK
jgi:hypothetical protein